MEYEIRDDLLIIRLYGEIDNQVVNKERTAITNLINKNNIYNLIINLEKVTYIDSAGVGLILGRYNQMQEKKGNALLVGTNNLVEKLFEITGIYKIIKCYRDEKEAISALEVIYE